MSKDRLLSDEELRDKLDEKLETLLGLLGERDENDNWWGFDTNVGTLEDNIEETLDSLTQLIDTQKRLFAESENIGAAIDENTYWQELLQSRRSLDPVNYSELKLIDFEHRKEKLRAQQKARIK